MLKLKVAGMKCGHCQQRVAKAVEAVPQSGHVEVNLEAGEVAIDGSPDERAVRQAIAEAGYEALETVGS